MPEAGCRPLELGGLLAGLRSWADSCRVCGWMAWTGLKAAQAVVRAVARLPLGALRASDPHETAPGDPLRRQLTGHPRGGWVAVSEEMGWLSHPEGLGPQVRRQGPPRVLLRGRTFPCRIQSGVFGVFGAERSGVSRTDEPLVSVWWKWLCTLSEGTWPLGVTWGPGQVFSLQASLSPRCPSGGRAGRCAVLSSPRKFIPEALFLGPDRGGNSKSPTV